MTLIRPPEPPREYPGIPYHLLLTEAFQEMQLTVIRRALLLIREGLPDRRQIVLHLDPLAEGLSVPLPVLQMMERENRAIEKIEVILAPDWYRELVVWEEGFSLELVFMVDGTPTWFPYFVPWEAVLFYVDQVASIALQVPQKKREIAPRPSEEEAKIISMRMWNDAKKGGEV